MKIVATAAMVWCAVDPRIVMQADPGKGIRVRRIEPETCGAPRRP